MTPKTNFGLTFKNNNVSKSAHISNVFKKSLDMLKSERIKGLDLKSVPTYLSHRLMGQIQPPIGGEPPMMVGRPQAEDIGTQLPPMEGVKPIQLTSLTKVKHLQTFTQFEYSENINHLAPYPLMDRASPQSEEKGYPPMVEKSFTPLGKTSVHKTIAKNRLNNYPSRALSKILKLVLTDYNLQGVQSVRAFFVRYISMRLHIYVELWRDTFECAGNLVDLSVNPLQLRTNQMTVISEAPKLQGVHNHA